LTKFLKLHPIIPAQINHMPFIPYPFQIYYNMNKGSKIYYQMFNRPSEQEIIPCQTKWNRELQINLDKGNWKIIFNIVHQTKIQSNLIWFQYRILHRILGTKKLLVQMNISDDSMCSFCKKQEETIIHLFTQCQIVQKFWSELKDHIYAKTNILCSFDIVTIILGYLLKNNWAISLNSIIIKAKHYIFKSSSSNKHLNVDEFVKELKHHFQIENYANTIEGNLEKFNKIWLRMHPLVI